MLFGIDTTTPEGREAFKKEWENMAEMVPELLSKDDIIYPHEHQRFISEEPHFRRVWQFYREHMFKLRFCQIVEAGDITQQEADAFKNFIDMQNVPTFNLYIYGRLG